MISLVAESGGHIVGLIDIECESEPGTVCGKRPGLGGMIWNLAVHPDYHRQGIARKLLIEARLLAVENDIARFQAYTRDDIGTLAWYRAMDFERVMSYLHVYMNSDESQDVLQSKIPSLRPVAVLAHCEVNDTEVVNRNFMRVHECSLIELRL